MFDTAHVWYEDAGQAQASRGPLFMLHACAAATPENIQRWDRNVTAFARQAHGPIGFLFHFFDNPTPPEEAGREQMKATLKRLEGRLAGLAICLPATGFTGAALRSVVSGVFIISRPAYPVKVVGQLQDALPWLAERVGVPVATASGLVEHAVTRLEVLSAREKDP